MLNNQHPYYHLPNIKASFLQAYEVHLQIKCDERLLQLCLELQHYSVSSCPCLMPYLSCLLLPPTVTVLCDLHGIINPISECLFIIIIMHLGIPFRLFYSSSFHLRLNSARRLIPIPFYSFLTFTDSTYRLSVHVLTVWVYMATRLQGYTVMFHTHIQQLLS